MGTFKEGNVVPVNTQSKNWSIFQTTLYKESKYETNRLLQEMYDFIFISKISDISHIESNYNMHFILFI